MTEAPQTDVVAERLLVLAPTARDAAVSQEVLRAAGVVCVICNSLEALCREAATGAAGALVTAEAVLGDRDGRLAALLQGQPPWSDLPLIVLTPPGPDSPQLLAALAAIGHMTLMKRPVQVSTLVSTVRSALRDRQRQYEVRDLLAERQQAAETLRVERERYRVTLSSIGDAVIATDTEGRVTFVNQVAQRTTGWDAASARGRPLQEVFHVVDERTRQPVANPALRALQEGYIVGLSNRTILLARDGTERPIDDSAAPIRGEAGEVTGAVLVFRDITEKKLAEKALREQEQRAAEKDERLQLVIGHATDYGLIMTDTVGRVLEWAGGAERITGWTEAEVRGQSAALIFTDEDRARGRPEAELQEAARTGRAEDKRWHRRKDGSLFFGDGVMVALRDAAGELRGFGKVFQDVTERKRAEEALREADRRKDDFIALLAHELRNPLAPIRNGLQVMRLAAGDASAVARAREMMDRQLGHMVRLIDDLLDVSRISRNKMELRRSRVLLTDIVSNAVETSRPAIEAAGHELVISLPPEPIFLEADLTRLAQVFSNLLSNSAKYTERGGSIRLSAQRHASEVIVSVCDTGIGIPPDALPRVFEMFSQVDRSIERSTGGLGIGLALVKGLVEMHGGSVAAASAGSGAGSTFTVRLPVLESPFDLGSEGAKVPERVGVGPQRRILVVDDNSDSATSMAMMLQLLGNVVRTAKDGVEAVAAADVFRPEVVLMDVGMPRLNGLDATRRLRELPGGEDMIVIALTGWGQDADRAQSKAAGCDGHLVKPITLAELDELLSTLTTRSGSRRA